MEWFFGFLDKIAASYAWKALFAQFQWVDWFTFGMVIVGLVYGTQNGMMREVVEIVETMVLIFLVLHFHADLDKFFRIKFMKLPSPASSVSAFILLGAFFGALIYFVDRHFRKLMKADTRPLIRITGGALLGVAHTIILWSFIVQMLILLPIPAVRKAFEKGNSVTGHAVRTLTPAIHDFLVDPAKAFKTVGGAK